MLELVYMEQMSIELHQLPWIYPMTVYDIERILNLQEWKEMNNDHQETNEPGDHPE